MSKISEEEVRHVAKLARLELKDSEVARLSSQLSAVFEYMEILEEVDCADVKETSQVTGLENVKEEDEVVGWEVGSDFCNSTGAVPVLKNLQVGESQHRDRNGGNSVLSGEELLKCSELSVESKQILVKAAINKK